MRLARLRWFEWLIAAGGIVLLVAMLALPWYRGPHGSLSGWQALTHLRWVFLAAAVVALAAAVLQATRPSPAIPVTVTLFATLLGAVATALLIYRVLADPLGGSRKVGGFLALAAAAAIAYGGWRSLRSDAVPDVDAPDDIPVVGSVA